MSKTKKEHELKATLTLNLTYTGADATKAVVKGQLRELMRLASGNGMFTGEFDMTIEEWDYDIETSEITAGKGKDQQ